MQKSIKALIKRLFQLLTGSTHTTALLIKEIALALLKRIAWKVVLERLLTRVLVGTLKWLKDLSTNRIVQETVEDILNSLRRQGLKEAKL